MGLELAVALPDEQAAAPAMMAPIPSRARLRRAALPRRADLTITITPRCCLCA
jgi:hypothetical protein